MRPLLFAAILALTGCTNSLRLAEESRAPGPLGEPRSSLAVVGHLEDPGVRDAIEETFLDRVWANDIAGSATGGQVPTGEFLLVRIEVVAEEQDLAQVPAFTVGDTDVDKRPRTPKGGYQDGKLVVLEASYWTAEPRRCVWVTRTAPYQPALPAEKGSLQGLVAKAADFADFVIAALKKERLLRSP